MTVCAFPANITDEKSQTASARRGIAIVIGLCFVGALLGRLSFIVRPFDADGAMFIYMGKLVAHGGRIGCELIDNKFPTVGLITSPFWQAFGDHWASYVFMQMAMTLLAVYLLARCARRNIGAYAELPVGLFALVYLNFNFTVRGGFQLESLQTFFSILAAIAAIEAIAQDDARDSFLCALAAGTAAFVKPSGLAPLAAFALVIAWQNRSDFRRLAIHAFAAILGLAIPIAATLLYFQAAELFPVLPVIWKQIAGYAANSPWELLDLTKPLIVGLIAGFPMIILGFIFRRPQHRVALTPDRTLLLFAILWLTIECLGVAAQRRLYAYHFLVLAAPVSLLIGFIPRHPRAIPLAAALALPWALSLWGALQVLDEAPQSMGRTASEVYLSTHAKPGDTVWLDGMMRLLIITDLEPGSRYPMTFLWINDDNTPLEYCHAMLADFDRIHPKFIVIPTHFDSYGQKLAARIKELGERPVRRANFLKAWTQLGDYVHTHYRPQAQCDWETVYTPKPQ